MPDISLAGDWTIGNETQDGSLEIVHESTGNTYKLTDTGELQSKSLDTEQAIVSGSLDIGGSATFSNGNGVTGTDTNGNTGNVVKLNQFDNIEVGDPDGNTIWTEFYTSGTQAAYFNQNQNLFLNNNNINDVNALSFGTDTDTRAIYFGSSGTMIHRSYNTAATIPKIWSPPEAGGGKEATLAMVVGDDDDYVYDVYNNSGYSSGTRAGQFGISFKHQSTATAKPFVFDFDKSALGGSEYVERLKIEPNGPLKVQNGNLDIGGNGEKMSPRGAPTTGELASGEVMQYVSDGTDAGNTGDLMYAINDGGTVKTQVIAPKSNAT